MESVCSEIPIPKNQSFENCILPVKVVKFWRKITDIGGSQIPQCKTYIILELNSASNAKIHKFYSNSGRSACWTEGHATRKFLPLIIEKVEPKKRVPWYHAVLKLCCLEVWSFKCHRNQRRTILFKNFDSFTRGSVKNKNFMLKYQWSWLTTLKSSCWSFFYVV